MKNNNIATAGYFIKRLRDNGYITIRLFSEYSMADPRKWSVVVDPGGQSLVITCYQNKEFKGDMYFEFNDGGNKFPNNYKLKTQSMEIVIMTLVEKDIPKKEDGGVFEKKSK